MHHDRIARRILAVAALAFVALALVSCGPEPVDSKAERPESEAEREVISKRGLDVLTTQALKIQNVGRDKPLATREVKAGTPLGVYSLVRPPSSHSDVADSFSPEPTMLFVSLDSPDGPVGYFEARRTRAGWKLGGTGDGHHEYYAFEDAKSRVVELVGDSPRVWLFSDWFVKGAFAASAGRQAIVIAGTRGGILTSADETRTLPAVQDGQVATGQAALDLLARIAPQVQR